MCPSRCSYEYVGGMKSKLVKRVRAVMKCVGVCGVVMRLESGREAELFLLYIAPAVEAEPSLRNLKR
jgi:hypothetical protein